MAKYRLAKGKNYRVKDQEKVVAWITSKINKQKIPVKEGQTHKEAVEDFAEKHEEDSKPYEEIAAQSTLSKMRFIMRF